MSSSGEVCFMDTNNVHNFIWAFWRNYILKVERDTTEKQTEKYEGTDNSQQRDTCCFHR